MPLQPGLAALMHRLARPELRQAVAHHQLVVARRKDGRRHVDQDRDPRVAAVRKGLAAEEDGRHDARAQVTRQVRADADVGEAPHHGRVGEADDEGRGRGRDEGVCGIEGRPDDDALGNATVSARRERDGEGQLTMYESTKNSIRNR